MCGVSATEPAAGTEDRQFKDMCVRCAAVTHKGNVLECLCVCVSYCSYIRCWRRHTSGFARGSEVNESTRPLTAVDPAVHSKSRCHFFARSTMEGDTEAQKRLKCEEMPCRIIPPPQPIEEVDDGVQHRKEGHEISSPVTSPRTLKVSLLLICGRGGFFFTVCIFQGPSLSSHPPLHTETEKVALLLRRV